MRVVAVVNIVFLFAFRSRSFDKINARVASIIKVISIIRTIPFNGDFTMMQLATM